MKQYQKIKYATVASCAALFTGCANSPSGPSSQNSNPFKQIFASDDPCSNNSRNIGIAVGVIGGLILGDAVGKGKSDSLAAGALVGGLLGGFIGADMDRKRCELSKVAKQYQLEIQFSPIGANGEVIVQQTAQASSPGKSEPVPNPIGTTLTVRDKGGAVGHFETGSDELTPKAREYFAAIATQYSPVKMLEGQTNASKREEINRQITARRLFLIGHTDDTGSSQLNASLSERRARAVANFLKQHGIQESSLYFQGAGETLPIADNRTEAGRAENRRVEILEVADEAGFKKYLDARRPNYQFYRPSEAANVQVAASTNASTKDGNVTGSAAKPSIAKTLPKPTVQSGAKPVTKSPAPLPGTSSVANAPSINFGGIPYSPKEATLNVGSLVPANSSFGLISKAYADEAVFLTDCTQDRPRAFGAVKSLGDGSTYKTNEHLPQLYGKTWASDVNGNLMVINRLAVLRDGGAPANLPELKVYSLYKPGTSKKPEVNEEPPVNSYLVSQGVLYRMFPRRDTGLQCVDILFPTDGSTIAKGGKIIYTAGSSSLVANFKPQMQ